MKCKLCQVENHLCDSHLIPSFVFKWLKNTSATGFLRSYSKMNLRVQDGYKAKMLCRDCEDIFNVHETEFANRLFHPYTSKELDEFGVARGEIAKVNYSDWLLRFVISLNWRLLINTDIAEEPISPKLDKLVIEYREIWRNFLLGKRNDTGRCDSHIIFLQNLATAQGSFPANMNKKINYYLLRIVDGTIMYSQTRLAVFCKIGPIAIMTFIKPDKIRAASSTRIKRVGQLPTAQTVKNQDIVNFLFITRPNEVMPGIEYSDKQKTAIEKAYEKNPEKSANSLTVKAAGSDFFLGKTGRIIGE